MAQPEPRLTRRLHVSGLTPSITPADLERRLSSFGKVTAMDGFDARDALGDPRKFGFVTMEIDPKELAKCFNVLSGATWKGAKLRIGEARPDFRERLAKFNSQPPRPVRPRRSRTHNHGRPSSTLPLIPLSAAAATSTPGWTVTPSGRVVRPMRMRPSRPLEPMHGELGASSNKSPNGKAKKRAKIPPTRARRRLIDPTKWDSAYLKGMFLDAVTTHFPAPEEFSSREADEEVTDGDGTDGDVPCGVSRQGDTGSRLARDRVHSKSDSHSLRRAAGQASVGAEYVDIQHEANSALEMLGKMFGDEDNWEGKEIIDDAENLEDNQMKEIETDAVQENDFELSLEESGTIESTWKVDSKGKKKSLGDIVCSDDEGEVDAVDARDGDVEMEDNPPPVDTEASTQTAEPAAKKDLKALFAPREEESFSLLEHLDLGLDLDLDTDILGMNVPPRPSENRQSSEPTFPKPRIARVPTTAPTAKARSRVTLDPSHPLLFPPPDALPHPYTHSSDSMPATRGHGAPTCFLFSSATRSGGLNRLPPSTSFARSPEDTDESIRERWEKEKSSLTHEWKKAWREARGSRKGKVGAGGEIGGGY